MTSPTPAPSVPEAAIEAARAAGRNWACDVGDGLQEMCANLAEAGARAALAAALPHLTPRAPGEAGEAGELTAMIEVVRNALVFADFAAGEGIGYADERTSPDEFLTVYTDATGDDEWESIADRLSTMVAGHLRSAIQVTEEEIARELDAAGAWWPANPAVRLVSPAEGARAMKALLDGRKA